jgi:hypothetical protein
MIILEIDADNIKKRIEPMQIVQNILSEEEFQSELVKRFFHPKSFFFRCINHELESMLAGKADSVGDHYLIMGSLLDKLVATETKGEFLLALSKVAGFTEYFRELNDGVRQLRESELDAERMKIKIEGLAQKFFQTAMAALNEASSSSHIKRLLGLDTVDMPLNLTLDEVASDIILEPPLISQSEAEPELTLDELPGLMEEDTDVLLDFGAGMEAGSEGGCEPEFSDEGGSKNVSSEPAAPAGICNQPASVVGAFQLHLRGKLDELQSALSGDAELIATWSNCEKIFDDLAAISMIGGFEAFELIANKCRKVVAVVKNNLVEFATPGSNLLLVVHGELISLLAADIDHPDDRIVKQLSQRLHHPQQALNDMKSVSRKSDSDDSDHGANENDDPNSESETRLQSISSFILPGEDDDDLMQLIREISDGERAPKPVSDEPVESENSHELENIFADIAALEKGASNQFAGDFKSFKQQAKPHFTCIGQALDMLRVQPASSRALEDLQAASNSLLGLSLNLNLLPLSYYPASVESLVRNIRSANAPLSENERFLIEDLYKNVFNLTRLDEIQARENRELLNLIQNLNSAMQMRMHDCQAQPDGFILADTRAMASA